jgi:hypothetical protein
MSLMRLYIATSVLSLHLIAACGSGAMAEMTAPSMKAPLTTDVMGVSQLTPELVLYVARLGHEETQKARAGDDVLELIRKTCGSVNVRRYYLPLFIAANAANESIRDGELVLRDGADLKFPACLKAEEAPTAVPITRDGPRFNELPRLFKDPAIVDQLVSEAVSRGVILDLNLLGPRLQSFRPALTSSRRDHPPAQALFDAPRAAVVPSTMPGGWEFIKIVDRRRLENEQIRSTFKRVVRETLRNQRTIQEALRNRNPGSFQYLPPAVRDAVHEFQAHLFVQDVVALNNVDFKNLAPGSFVLGSGQAPISSSFLLSRDVDRAKVKQTLERSGREARLTGNYSPILAGPLSEETKENCSIPPKTPWPYDLGELKKVLRLRALAKGQKPVPGRVIVFDSGFPSHATEKTPFRQHWFVQRSVDRNATDESAFVDSVVPGYKSLYYIRGFKASGHGVSVLTMALGGVEALKDETFGKDHIALHDGMVLPLMGYAEGEDLAPDGRAVQDILALRNITRGPWRIVNLSLSFDDLAGNPEKMMEQSILFVVAAGNVHEPTWLPPAIWGGEASKNVLTVGAVRPDGQYAKFSTFGRGVDIAAPGCGVPTLTWDYDADEFKEEPLDGTSLAAPLVSFTASLLAEYYVEPGAIKARLLASARYSEELKEKVRSARVLDIPTAVATPFDVVRWTDGTISYGRVNWPTEQLALCGKVYSKKNNLVGRRLLQMHFSGETDTRVQITFQSGLDNTKVQSDEDWCALEGDLPDLTFQEAMQEPELPLSGEQGLHFTIVEGDTLTYEEKKKQRIVKSITFCDVCYQRW